MKVVIRAIAPTALHVESLRAFGMGCSATGNNSFHAQLSFNRMDEAKIYLMIRAVIYNDNNPDGSNREIERMFKEIEEGRLLLDAVTAYIYEEKEETDDDDFYEQLNQRPAF